MVFLFATVAGTVAILLTLRRINRKLDTLMADEQTDQQVLDEIVSDLNNAEAGIATEISTLEAQVAAIPVPAGATPIDFTGLKAALAQYKALVPIPAGTSSTPGDGGAVS